MSSIKNRTIMPEKVWTIVATPLFRLCIYQAGFSASLERLDTACRSLLNLSTWFALAASHSDIHPEAWNIAYRPALDVRPQLCT